MSRALLGAALACLCIACAHGTASFPADATARPAADLPATFVAVAEPEPDATSLTCRSPLLDPRDGARLTMVRSSAGRRGDYQVPAGRYGVGENELLRVDCATGAAIGVVRR